MKTLSTVLFAMLLASSAPQAAQEYFSNVRDVQVKEPSRQAYVVVDPEIWARCRRDLADIRLYAPNGSQVPYALSVQGASTSSTESQAKVLNLGTEKGETGFVIDAGENVFDYNRVQLTLDSKNYIARATVEGLRDPLDRAGVKLGEYTLYDFSKEDLGSNSTLKLESIHFRYLHVSISAPVTPEDVKGATISYIEERQARWATVPVQPSITQQGKQTIVTWNVPGGVPIDRVVFDIDPAQVNFRRTVVIYDHDGSSLESSELSRVHLVREGRTVDSESVILDVPAALSSGYKAVIDNGDDAPLKILGIKPQTLERRIYFDPQGNSSVRMYYGDPLLDAPVYDYAKFFENGEPNAVEALLAPGQHNASYTGRPDERPWTEKHPWVLWTALIVAVLGLGAIALRGLKTP